MIEMSKDQQLKFQIRGIEILDVNLIHPNIPIPSETIFHFNLHLEHRVNIESNLVIVTASIDVIHEDKTTKLAFLKASCIFEVTNLHDFINEPDKAVVFPDEILVSFNSVSISTIRGIMFSQFKGTFLHSAILPIIDPKSFVAQHVKE